MKVIVTGAFGNVGQWALTELINQGHEAIAFEIKNERTEKKQQELLKKFSFRTEWGDLTNEDAVKGFIEKEKPEAITHIAAVIAPTAYVIPDIAYKVNVLGSRYLIDAVSGLEIFKRFVFVSSYSVHGPRNPHKNLPPITGDTPTNPGDNYGKHKVLIEKTLEASNLDWTIIRLPAVFPRDKSFGSGDEFQTFGMMLDPDRNQSGIDAADAGLAIANAITAESSKRKFDICGDPAKGWTGKARILTGAIIRTMGIKPFSDLAYRRSDPEIDESWYYEDIVDPTEAQNVLKFQRSSLEEYVSFKEKQAGFMRYILKIFGGMISNSMTKKSPFYDSGIQTTTVWEDVKTQWNLDESELKVFEELK